MPDAQLGIIASMHDTATRGLQSMQSTLGGFGNELKKVGTIAAGVALGGLIGQLGGGLSGALKQSIGSVQELGSATRRLQREIGGTAEQASGLLAVFHRFGLSADDASRSLGIFSKHIAGLEDLEDKAIETGKGFAGTMRDLGVNFLDAEGNARRMTDVLLDVADKFKAMPDGVDKTAMAMNLFGRAGKDMIPVLNLGREGMTEAMATAKKYGLVLSQDNVDAIKRFGFAHKDMEEAMGGLTIQIGTMVMPVLTRLAQGAATLAQEFNQKAVPAIRDVANWAGEIVRAGGDLIGFFRDSEGAGLRLHNALERLVGLNVSNYIIGVVKASKDLLDTLEKTATALWDNVRGWKALREHIEPVTTLIKEHKEILAGLLTTFLSYIAIVKFLELLAGIKAAFIGISAAVTGITAAGGIGAVFAGLGAVLAAPLTIILLIAAAMGALVAAWLGNWGDIQGKTAAAVAFVGQVLGGLPAILTSIWENIIGDAKAKWNDFAGVVNAAIGVLNLIIQVGWWAIYTTAQTFWAAFGDPIRLAWEGISAVLTGALALIGDLVTAGWQVILDITTTFWDAIFSHVQIRATETSSVVSQGLDAIVGFFGGAADTVRAIVHSLFDAVLGWFGGMIGKAREAVDIIGGIVNQVQGMLGAIQGAVDAARAAIGGMPSIPSLPTFDLGGVVPGAVGVPTLAIVHGGETITPPGAVMSGSSGGIGGGGNVYVTVVVQGSVTAERDLAERIRRELLYVGGRNANIFGGLA